MGYFKHLVSISCLLEDHLKTSDSAVWTATGSLYYHLGARIEKSFDARLTFTLRDGTSSQAMLEELEKEWCIVG